MSKKRDLMMGKWAGKKYGSWCSVHFRADFFGFNNVTSVYEQLWATQKGFTDKEEEVKG